MIDKVYILFFILGLSSLTCGMFLTAHLDLDWPHLVFNSPKWLVTVPTLHSTAWRGYTRNSPAADEMPTRAKR